MEHRWGERVALRLAVELSSGSSPPIAGSVENVSASGAFVRTAGLRPPRGPVDVTLHGGASGCAHERSVRLPAYVVRETDVGVGIEWCEFAPRAVRELMVRDRRAAARTRARSHTRSRSSRRRSAPGSNASTGALAQPGTGDALAASSMPPSAPCGSELGAAR